MSQQQSKADLHFHTWHSIDSFISPKDAVEMAVKRDIQVLAITDHDTIEGAKAAQTYAVKQNLPVEIIIGEEIYTNGGHVIGLFLKERVPSFQSLEETLLQIKAQNGLVVIPHMMFEEDALGEYIYRYQVCYLDLVNRPDLLAMVDAIEVQNFALIEPQYFEKTHFINEKFLQKAEVSSSDSHIKMNFGHTFSLFDGHTAQDLRTAIQKKKTIPLCIKKKNLVHQISGWGPIVKLPIHLTLQFTYRIVENIYVKTKETVKKHLPTRRHKPAS